MYLRVDETGVRAAHISSRLAASFCKKLGAGCAKGFCACKPVPAVHLYDEYKEKWS